jgi:hypothetical protein
VTFLHQLWVCDSHCHNHWDSGYRLKVYVNILAFLSHPFQHKCEGGKNFFKNNKNYKNAVSVLWWMSLWPQESLENFMESQVHLGDLTLRVSDPGSLVTTLLDVPWGRTDASHPSCSFWAATEDRGAIQAPVFLCSQVSPLPSSSSTVTPFFIRPEVESLFFPQSYRLYCQNPVRQFSGWVFFLFIQKQKK